MISGRCCISDSDIEYGKMLMEENIKLKKRVQKLQDRQRMMGDYMTKIQEQEERITGLTTVMK